MNPLELFALILFCGLLAVGGFIVAVVNGDRLVVIACCLLRLPVFVEARMIAALIHQRPEEWSSGRRSLHHASVGSITVSVAPLHVDVSTALGNWRPNAFERRIIWDAAQWRLRTYVRQRVGAELSRALLR